MGFNKRFISVTQVEKCIEFGKPLNTLFDADALIFQDQISFDVMKWFLEGVEENEIKSKLKLYKNEDD